MRGGGESAPVGLAEVRSFGGVLTELALAKKLKCRMSTAGGGCMFSSRA